MSLVFLTRAVSHPDDGSIRAGGLDLVIDLAYPGQVRKVVRVGSLTTRFAVEVQGTAAPLLTDFRFPLLRHGVPIQLEDYRAALREAHDLKLSALVVKCELGASVIELPGSEEYWEYLHQVHSDFLLGIRSLILSTVDKPFGVMRASFTEVYRQYRHALRSNAGCDEIAIRGAIEAARSVDALDAIRFD